MAAGRSHPAAAARRAQARPQQGLDAPRRPRRDLDAGQVGVSVVRGVGSGVPLHRVRRHRSRVREGAARAPHARVVHAPQRPAPRVRVGLRRRESAGARVGGVARVPDRPAAAAPRQSRRSRRPRFPRAHLPEAAAQLHLVGEPQGRAGTEHLPGRIPRPRQHRRLRPQPAAAHRRLHQSGRRHELDGDVLPEHAAHRAASSRVHDHATRTSPPSSSSTSCRSRPRSTAWATRRWACGTRKTSSTTTT